jgi:hypothetical protein
MNGGTECSFGMFGVFFFRVRVESEGEGFSFSLDFLGFILFLLFLFLDVGWARLASGCIESWAAISIDGRVACCCKVT